MAGRCGSRPRRRTRLGALCVAEVLADLRPRLRILELGEQDQTILCRQWGLGTHGSASVGLALRRAVTPLVLVSRH